MSGVVRIEALRALAALIEAAIPELAGNVCTGIAPSSELEAYPNISINPTRWRYDPTQAEQVATLPGNVVVYDVGTHECACVLSLVTTNPVQRYEIEQKLIDLWLSATNPAGFERPGVLVLAITACPELSEFVVTYDLDSDEWADGLALDRRYESRIMLTCSIPALTIARPIYTIEQLILGVTEDRTTTFTAATAIPPAVELVSILEDGTVEPFAP